MMFISKTENFELNPTFELGMNLAIYLGKITPRAFLLCGFPCYLNKIKGTLYGELSSRPK